MSEQDPLCFVRVLVISSDGHNWADIKLPVSSQQQERWAKENAEVDDEL